MRHSLLLASFLVAGQPVSAQTNAPSQGETIIEKSSVLSDAEAQLLRARILSYKDETLDEAIKEYLKLRQSDPENMQVRVELGSAYMRRKMLREALSEFLDVLNREPGNRDAALNAGRIHLWSARPNDAVEILSAIVERDKSDNEARRQLARAFTNSKLYKEAVVEYEILLDKAPSPDAEIIAEAGDAYFFSRDLSNAIQYYDRALARDSKLIGAKRNLGLSLSRQGSDERAQRTLEEVYPHFTYDLEVTIELARLLARRGEFDGAATVLERYPERESSNAVLIELADVEAKRGRAKRSRELYHSVFAREKPSDELLLRYAGTAMNWGDFYVAEKIYRDHMERHGESHDLWLSVGWVLVSAQRYEEAEGVYLKLLRRYPEDAGVLSALATLKFFEKDFQAALAYSEWTLRYAPKNRAALQIKAKALEFLGRHDEARAVQFQLESRAGSQQAEIPAQRQVSQSDKDRLPDQVARAEEFSAQHDYDAAIEIYRKLAKELPGSQKLGLAIARAYSWSRRYEAGISEYRKLLELNPGDPVPQRELARVYVWNKDMEGAAKEYAKLTDPSVDFQLMSRLQDIDAPKLAAAIRDLNISAESGTVYKGYETFSKTFGERTTLISPSSQGSIENALLDLYPQYILQKQVSLESEAKMLSWQKRPFHAMEKYRELIQTEPGNVEARFDHAQLECALGLHKEAQKSYQQLIDVAFSHSLAEQALKKEKSYERAALVAQSSYWDEEGRGELSDITRKKTALGAVFPIEARHTVALDYLHWRESPGFNGERYLFDGGSISAAVRATDRMTVNGTIWRKEARNQEIDSTSAGALAFWWQANDYLRLAAGYEHTDQITNFFALEDGVQFDQLWLDALLAVNHETETGAKIKMLDYSDNNEALHVMSWMSYAFSEQPHVAKVIAAAEYRDTQEEDHFVFSGAELVDIIHPYWTPQKYFAGSVTFEWYHDLSSLFFCGNDLHYYDIKLSAKADSDGNPGFELRGEWHREFDKHWMLVIEGMLHRSEEWDAQAASLLLQYRL